MPKYSVLIEGRNFPARAFAGSETELGFYATRFVEAEDPNGAELATVSMLREELGPVLGKRHTDEPTPTMHLDEIIELDAFPKGYVNKGTTWFPMDED